MGVLLRLRAFAILVLTWIACVAIPFSSPAEASPHPAEGAGSSSSTYSCAPAKPKAAPIGSRLTLTANLGTYTASVQGIVGSITYGFPALSHLTVTLGAAGKTIESFQPFALLPSTTIGSIEEASTGWNPGKGLDPSSGFTSGSICIARLTGTSVPTVLVPVSTGFGQCCEIINLYGIYAFPGGSFADPVGATNLGPEGPAILLEEKGAVLFVTADTSFFGRFTDDAGTAMPIRIYDMNVNTGFTDVTNRWPSLISADAKYWMAQYLQKPRGDVRGIIAAWAADECRLGRCATAFSYLEQQAKAGNLTGGVGPRPASASAFISTLRSYLQTTGY